MAFSSYFLNRQNGFFDVVGENIFLKKINFECFFGNENAAATKTLENLLMPDKKTMARLHWRRTEQLPCAISWNKGAFRRPCWAT